MPLTDPVMAVVDRLPLADAGDAGPTVGASGRGSLSPFGLRFAVAPVSPSDKHKKTYYTVTVKEATRVSRDGKVETIQDDVERQRED